MANYLEVGDTAPGFEATTVTGGTVSLGKLAGKLVWLLFYRYPGCPFCNRHIRSLGARLQWLKDLDVHPIAIFDSAESAFEPSVMQEMDLNSIPMIADEHHQLYDHYRVPRSLKGFLSPRSGLAIVQSLMGGGRQERFSGNLLQMPASFFIDQGGVLQNCHYGTSIGDLPGWEAVQTFSRKFRVVTWNPVQNKTLG